MIINGGSRSGGAFFARHLMHADQNEHVTVNEIRGLAAQDVRGAFREMEAIASGTQCTNYFYHANLNPREDERLTPQQWELAVDTLEKQLRLTGQPRIVVEHEKDGRTHRHVVWSRIDADSMATISDSLTYAKHERAAREIEQAFGLSPVGSVLVKDRGTPRPERNPQDWESFRGQESKLDPKAIKAEVTALWHGADSGAAFAAALQEHGYILARGDRRDFCIVDRAGDEHSLARRLAGIKAAELRTRLVDIDREQLPTLAMARAMARDAGGGGGAPVAGEPELEARLGDVALSKPKAQFLRPSEAEYQKLAQEARSGTPVPDDVVEHAKMGRTKMDEDMRVAAQHPPAPPPGWFERMRHLAAHMADVWREEATDHDHGKVGVLLHAGRVLKRVLSHEEPKEEPAKEKAPDTFADRVAQTGRDLLTNERGSGPGLDKFDAWIETMREHFGETLHPPDPYGQDEPEHDRGGPDIDIEW